ncbi:uncharacterized protein LOC129743934 [Uranotaenia lowii]|uniref:uncharacterized protein LOC129743934 n=1 Tax=Uranotaenia lowii TaxID=190385 RepID=UPI002479D895|nr:uncharacterized protein LOC129743934 [Uranotaenia lowii]
MILLLLLLSVMSVNSLERCIDYDSRANDINSCCKIGLGLPIDPFLECLQTANDLVPDREKHNFLACAFDCYAEKVGIIKNNTVVLEKIIEYIDELLGSQFGVDLRKTAWRTCATLAPKMAADISGHKYKCNPFALEVQTCAQFEVNRICPATVFDDEVAVCREVRSGIPHCIHK